MAVKRNFLEKVKVVMGIEDSEVNKINKSNITYVQREETIELVELDYLDNKSNLKLVKPPKIVIKTPIEYNDVTSVVENFRNRYRVVVDYKKINENDKKKMFDFLSGAIFALEGSIERMDKNKYVYLPIGECYIEDIKLKFGIRD